MEISGLEWKEKIKKWARELGFVAAGFTSSEPEPRLEQAIKERMDHGCATSFEGLEADVRSNPKLVWPECQTVAAFAYPTPLSTPARPGEGIIARSAVGEDYHLVIRRRLEELVERVLAAGWAAARPRIQVDNGLLSERSFAARAGVGWVGRNQLLIVPDHGSFINIGLVLLDQFIPPDAPIENRCGTCTSCIQACPVQILGGEHFPANKCLSYFTQTKEELTAGQAVSLGLRIYGCDTCQEVCPYNRKRVEEERSLSRQPQDEVSAKAYVSQGVDLMDTLSLTKSEFNRRFRSTAAGWRGKGVLQRNAFMALRNSQDPRLEEWLANQDERDVPLSRSARFGSGVL